MIDPGGKRMLDRSLERHPESLAIPWPPERLEGYFAEINALGLPGCLRAR